MLSAVREQILRPLFLSNMLKQTGVNLYEKTYPTKIKIFKVLFWDKYHSLCQVPQWCWWLGCCSRKKSSKSFTLSQHIVIGDGCLTSISSDVYSTSSSGQVFRRSKKFVSPWMSVKFLLPFYCPPQSFMNMISLDKGIHVSFRYLRDFSKMCLIEWWAWLFSSLGNIRGSLIALEYPRNGKISLPGECVTGIAETKANFCSPRAWLF